MKMYPQLKLLFAIAFLISVTGFSQTVIKPDVSSFDVFLKEVYVEEGKIDVDSRRYTYLKELYQNRLIYKIMESEALNKNEVKQISEIDIITTFNNQLRRDTNFIAATFNPFKYNLNFYSKSIQVFKLENTDYVMVIYPQIISSLNRP